MFQRAFRLSGCWWGLVLCTSVLGAAGGCNRTPVTDPVLAGKPPETAAVESKAELSLPEAERERIWEIEHRGQILNKYGFKAIRTALSEQSAAKLTYLLAADFQGAELEAPQEISSGTGCLEVRRLQESDRGRQPLTAERFVERLLGYRQRFKGKAPLVQISLMTLSPKDPKDSESPLWEGKCYLRLYGEESPGKPLEVAINLEYRIARPSEEAFKQKGWLHGAAISQTLVGRSEHYLLKDMTAERGINTQVFHDNWYAAPRDKRTNTGGVFLCDFDRDGILDLLVTDTNGYFLYKGIPGGKFKEVTEEVGLPRRPEQNLPVSVLAAFVDLDGDGWEDLILGNRIFRNEQGKRFVDVTHRSNLRIPMDASGIALADFDRDGKVDLYITRPGKTQADSWLSGKSGDTKGNQLWRNKGNWQFEDVTIPAGAGGGFRSTFSAVWLDANNDGWPDLYVINEFGDGVLLVNNQDGTFRAQLIAKNATDFGTMGVTCGDIDNDGFIDIYAANMYSKAGSRVVGNMPPGCYPAPVMQKIRSFVAGSQLWHNKGNLQFEKTGQKCQVSAVGWAYGAALVDLDNDGFLDLYATAGFMSNSRNEPDG